MDAPDRPSIFVKTDNESLRVTLPFTERLEPIVAFDLQLKSSFTIDFPLIDTNPPIAMLQRADVLSPTYTYFPTLRSEPTDPPLPDRISDPTPTLPSMDVLELIRGTVKYPLIDT
jgi:hypothetical protein